MGSVKTIKSILRYNLPKDIYYCILFKYKERNPALLWNVRFKKYAALMNL